MPSQPNQWVYVPFFTLGAYILALLYVLAANNLEYRGIWWDEAAQFWIALGLNSYAEPFSNPAGLVEVIRFNNGANLDPGLFSILLHWWTVLGKSLSILRILPFLFLLVSMISLGLLAWRWTGDRLFSIAACVLPLCYQGITYFAFEIRAYSMEMAGMSVCTLLLVWLLDNASLRKAVLLGLACAVFMGSRYSFFLFVLALAMAWLLSGRLAGRPLDAAARIRFAVFAVLIMAAGTICYYVTLRHQIWSDMRGAPFGIRAPEYTQLATLRGSDDVSALVKKNLFSPAALPITLAIFWSLFLRPGFVRHIRASRGALPAGAGMRFAPVYAMILLFQAISILVSVLGVYPWDIDSRWSACLLMLSAISVLTMCAELLVALRSAAGRGPQRCLPGESARVMAWVFAVGIFSLGTANAVSHRNSVEGAHRTSVALQLDQLPAGHLHAASVFVAHFEIPMLRYLYEYGPYAGRKEYPGAFRFEDNSEFRSESTLDASAEGLEYVVSAWTPEQLARRLKGYDVVRVNGSRLRRIECPLGRPRSICGQKISP